jgi:alpha-tubulin suppressor-like RCC1 family protein
MQSHTSASLTRRKFYALAACLLLALLFGLASGGWSLPPRPVRASSSPPADIIRSSASEHVAASSSISVTSLWGGARDSIALKFDGTVWTWGLNNCVLGNGPCGKLGDGTITDRHVPTQVHGPGNVGYLNSITAIMGGEHANYALKSDGTVWAWGGNFVGQLGDGTYTNTVTPVQVSGLISVTMLGGRGYHNLAVKSDGTVWAWGWNRNGELGHDTSASPCPPPLTGTCSNVPVQVIGVTNPLTVTGGGFFSLALMPDHTILGWGQNNHGELGDESYSQRSAPVHASSVLSNVVNVSAGWFHAVALTADNKVWTWGNNSNGESGTGVTSTAGISVPIQVPGLDHVIQASAGDGFTAILKSDGTVWTWGVNNFGELGDGTFNTRATPAQVQGLSDVVYLAARDYHVLVIKSDGSVWAWGSNENGECGDNTIQDRTHPVQVLFDLPVTPTVTSALVVTGAVGVPFSYTFTATGTLPITLTVTGLPAWASFNSPVISGTPEVSGTFPVTLTATNSIGSDQRTLTIFIDRVFNVYLPLILH